MDQVDFGVRNCCTQKCTELCGKDCKTAFIYKVTIKVSPTSYAQDYSVLLVRPYPKPEIFNLQRSASSSLHISLDPRQAALTHSCSRILSYTDPEFGWGPPRIDSSNSVSWQWEFLRYTNGRKLEFNKRVWGSRPRLGIQPYRMNYPPGSFVAEASWKLPENADLQTEEPQWDLTVTLHTASLKRIRRLPGYVAVLGRMITYNKSLAFS
jgi:hypothetical protein